jgi:hypothetical protein
LIHKEFFALDRQALSAVIPFLLHLRSRLQIAADASQEDSPTSSSASSSAGGGNEAGEAGMAGSGGHDDDDHQHDDDDSADSTATAAPDSPSSSSFSSYLSSSRATQQQYQYQQQQQSSSSGSGGAVSAKVREAREAADLLALIDTMLLKAYLLTDERLVMPFVQQPNRAYVDDAIVRQKFKSSVFQATPNEQWVIE